MQKLNEISGEIKALEAKIESVDSKVDVRIDAVEKEVASLRSETLTELEVADAKVESLRKETKGAIESLEKVTISRFEAVDRRFDSLEAKLPVMEKIAELEARLETQYFSQITGLCPTEPTSPVTCKGLVR